MFQKGVSGNPKGRPKMVARIMLPEALSAHNCDVSETIAKAVKDKDYRTISGLEPILPYVFVKLTAAPFQIKPPNPDASVRNAEAVQQELNNAINQAKSGSDSVGMGNGRVGVEVQADSNVVQPGLGTSAEGQPQVHPPLYPPGKEIELADSNGVHEVHQGQGS